MPRLMNELCTEFIRTLVGVGPLLSNVINIILNIR